jgi:signal transduction histidine kinase/ligand-binding sensor domain-containing protein
VLKHLSVLQARLAAVLAALAVLGIAQPAAALDPDRVLAQYLRDEWGREQGFPGGPVYGITQTADGYLWIAAEKGLVRFDGISFRLIEPSAEIAPTGPTVLGVAAGPDGSVWARLKGSAMVRFRHGALENILPMIGLPGSVVTAMLPAGAGRMLLTTVGEGAVSFQIGESAKVVAPREALKASFIISVAETRGGDLWFGTRDAGLLRLQGSSLSRIVQGLPNAKINCLLAGENGELWIGTDRGVARWTADVVTTAGVPEGLRTVSAIGMIRDRDSNLWIAAGARGLLRVNNRGLITVTSGARPFAGAVTAVFEDRERNLWVGTTRGIVRLRDGGFTTFSTAQSVPADGVGPVYVDSSGRVWFGPGRGGLYRLQDGRIDRVNVPGLGEDVVYSITGGGEDVWVGRQRGGLTRVRPGAGASVAAHTFTQANGLAQNSVYAVHRTRDGTIWAGTLSGGASRLKDGVFTTYSTANGLASNTVASILESADGTLWFATPSGVSTLSHGVWHQYAAANGLPADDVNTLFEDAAGTVWAGTSGGAAFFRGGQFHSPGAIQTFLRGSVVGFAEDSTGSLWMETTDRLVRVPREAFARGAFADGVLREFGTVDGLTTLEGVKRHRSVIADGRGRIWISRTSGLVMADPVRLESLAMPVLSHIESVFADGEAVDAVESGRIPAGRRRVTIDYTGLSLAAPEHVMFRYRLDDFDKDWSLPLKAREAVYTNLPPGAYRFRLQAANGDGQWNAAEASVGFVVEPSAWQTTWFRASAIVLCALAGWGMFRLRLLHLSRRLNRRFEAQLAERARLAQELHDTLLQGFISASMQLHVATAGLPADSPVVPSLTRVLDLMGRVIEDGRNAVRGLRSARSAPHDLEQAFADLRNEQPEAGQTDYRVIVEGEARALHPLVRDEVYKIGREALVNAFRHARAQSVEVELDYAPGRLRMDVRDDGRGIDPAIASSGADGHWGLAGMRERAEKIGGQLTIRSRGGAGTEVELTVPGPAAFDQKSDGAPRTWIARLTRRRRSAHGRNRTENEP